MLIGIILIYNRMNMMFKSSIERFFIFLAILSLEVIFTSGACKDANSNCGYWASKGECQKSYLYMLQKCPQSCRVCSGGISCVNNYNDEYCRLHTGNCWRQSYVKDLINNCRKTCVCSCCSTTPATTPTNATTTTTTTTTTATTTTTPPTTKVSTTPQTTTERTGDERTTLMSLSTQKASVVKETTTLPTTATKRHNSGQDSAKTTQKGEVDTVLLLAIIAGIVVVIGILGLSLICFWRRKRSGSSQTLSKERPSTEFPQIPDTETVPNAPIYHVLEGPNDTSPRKNQALSVHYERSSDRFRSKFDYDDPAEQGTRAMIGSSSIARENDAQYETVNKVRNSKHVMNNISNSPTIDNSVEYCYSYNVANQDLSLEVTNNEQHGVPYEQGPRYHVLERPNNGYQSLEGPCNVGSTNNGYQSLERPCDVASTNGAYEPVRDIKPSNYQELDQATQSFYHPLKKT